MGEKRGRSFNRVDETDIEALFAQIPPANPNTFGGSGRGHVEVVGLAACDDVTGDSLSKAIEDRALAWSDYDITPRIRNSDAVVALEFLSIVEDTVGEFRGPVSDQDLSGILLVVPQKDGQAGKLVYFMSTTRRGKPVVRDVNSLVSRDRLIAEKKQAFLRQLELEVPSRVKNIHLKVEPDDLDWPLLSTQVIGFWLDRKITEKQLDKIQALLHKLQAICEGNVKAYIAGAERTLDIKDFITLHEQTGEHYLDIAFTVPKTGEEEVKLQ